MTKNLLSLLKKSKVIRIKKNIGRTSGHLDKVFEEFRELAKENKEVRCLESKDPVEMVVLYDLNYKIDSFIV